MINFLWCCSSSWCQPPKLDYKGKYKQRATAMKIVGEYVSMLDRLDPSDSGTYPVHMCVQLTMNHNDDLTLSNA